MRIKDIKRPSWDQFLCETVCKKTLVCGECWEFCNWISWIPMLSVTSNILLSLWLVDFRVTDHEYETILFLRVVPELDHRDQGNFIESWNTKTERRQLLKYPYLRFWKTAKQLSWSQWVWIKYNTVYLVWKTLPCVSNMMRIYFLLLAMPEPSYTKHAGRCTAVFIFKPILEY